MSYQVHQVFCGSCLGTPFGQLKFSCSFLCKNFRPKWVQMLYLDTKMLAARMPNTARGSLCHPTQFSAGIGMVLKAITNFVRFRRLCKTGSLRYTPASRGPLGERIQWTQSLSGVWPKQVSADMCSTTELGGLRAERRHMTSTLRLASTLTSHAMLQVFFHCAAVDKGVLGPPHITKGMTAFQEFLALQWGASIIWDGSARLRVLHSRGSRCTKFATRWSSLSRGWVQEAASRSNSNHSIPPTEIV